MHVERAVCAVFPQQQGALRESCSGNRFLPDFKVQELRTYLSADFSPTCLMSVRHKISLCIQCEFSARTAERYSNVTLF